MSDTLLITICPECDLLIHYRQDHNQNVCPRCQAHLPPLPSPEQTKAKLRLAFWFAISGLLLAVPALSLPLATLKLAGMERHCTLLSGVEILWQQGHPIIASLVLVTSILAPILMLLTTGVLATLLRFRSHPVWIRYLLRLYEHATQWGMLDVYLLSLLVAYIKLIDYGHVTLGLGLLCYLLVMLMNVVTLRQFTSRVAWHIWKQQFQQKRTNQQKHTNHKTLTVNDLDKPHVGQ